MHGVGGSRTRSHTFRTPLIFFHLFPGTLHSLKNTSPHSPSLLELDLSYRSLGLPTKILTSGWSIWNLDIIIRLPNVDHHLLRPIFHRLQNLNFSFACTATATASNLVSVPKPIVGLQQATWLAVLWKQKLWMNTKPLESLLTVPHLCLHCRQIDSGALNHQCADNRTSVGTFAYFALHLQLFVPF